MTDLATLAAQMSPRARELLARELVRVGTALPIGSAADEPVAVIGIGCRMPGNIVGPESFWEFVNGGRDAISEVPADRWDTDAYYDPNPAAPDRMTTRWGGFLSDVAGFDADFFGIAPREAQAMDPQHRILLEVAYEALEHAGIPYDSLAGSRTAVMAGLSTWDYMLVSVERRADIDAYLTTGIPHSPAVGRISYLLGLRGPAVAVDTACSSSLVAVHLACQSLRLRESDLALAGGAQVNLSPFKGIALSKYSALSPVGRCKAFDAAADGFVQSEGCGILVLKRLTDALRDGDRVLSVVRGTAVNQDGRSNGLTAPNLLAQRDVITEALRAGDIDADTVSYVETHGTGTPLGDPIEFEALAATYGRGDGRCALGAVKSNLGHLEAAAGIAGMIKATLALGRGRIPPNLHFHRWNPAIDPSSTQFFVPTETTDWPGAGPRRAAVSAFGFSGTNAHVVLEQPPDVDGELGRAPDAPISTLVISGKTGARVGSMAGVLADWMIGAGADVPLADVAHTLNRHRTGHGKLATVCARDRQEAIAGLHALAANQPAVHVVGPHEGRRGPGTVFVYSGQGSQWPGMGRQLLEDEQAFAAAIASLDPEFVAQVGFSLERTLSRGDEVVGIDRIQPVLVGVQLALTELWRSYGVEPDAAIGHSMGEISAAVVTGALSVADGLRLVATRSRLMARLATGGAMALLELDAAATRALIEDHPEVTLAVYASPHQSVIAGPPEIIESLMDSVQRRNRLARLVGVDVASHHPSMDPVLPELRAALAGLSPRTPAIPLISTAFDNKCATPALDVDYWAANLRNPVHFMQAVTSAAARHATFVEISPHPLLTHAITDTLRSAATAGGHEVASTINRHQPETLYFRTQLAAVAPRSATAGGRFVDIPTTPWRHARYWFPDNSKSVQIDHNHPLLGAHVEIPPDGDHAWRADIGTEAAPWLADHRMHGQPVMPAAAFLEIVLAAGSEALDLPVAALRLNRLEIERMLPLDGSTAITTRLMHQGDSRVRVEIYSRNVNWARHAVALVEVAPPRTAPAPAPPTAEGAGIPLSPTDFYARLRRGGEQRGPAFAALTRIVRLQGNASDTDIAVPDAAPRHRGYRMHPVVLDAALHSLRAAAGDESPAGADEVAYAPVSLDGLRVFGDVGERARCRAELLGFDEDGSGLVGRIRVTDDDGNPTVEIACVRMRPVERGSIPVPLERKVFDATWVEKSTSAPGATPPSAPAPGSWLVLADGTDAAATAQGFGSQLRSPQHRVVTANLGDEAAVLEAFAETAADAALPPVGVVVFVPQRPLGKTDLESALRRARESVWSMSTVVRAVVRGWHGRSPRLWLVTDRGLELGDGEPGDPAVGPLKGLIRVLAYEHPELRATLVDLDPDVEPFAALNAELSSSDGDDVIAWRGRHRYVERFSRASLGPPQLDPVVRQGGSYIVTGGLGGVGMVVTRWLVDNGAGRVILNGRRGPSPEIRKALAEMEKQCEIAVIPGDISAPGVAAELVAAAEESTRPLRGVIHAAAVVEDALLLAMSRESLERVWAGKAIGAVRMHDATATRQLDWWVAFSSAASLLGSPGQTAYASANAWLDTLVAWRRASGLPAVAIDWGQWSDVGVGRSLTYEVLDPMSPAEGIEALGSLLARDRVRTGVLPLRPDRALAAFPEIRRLGYFAGLAAEVEEPRDDDWPGPERLRDLDLAEARRIISDRIGRPIAGIMGFADQSAIDPMVPLIDLGMDSLLAVRIRNTVSADLGVEPSVALLLQGASLPDLIGDVIRQLGFAVDDDGCGPADNVRDRAQQRAAARHEAAVRRKRGHPV